MIHITQSTLVFKDDFRTMILIWTNLNWRTCSDNVVCGTDGATTQICSMLSQMKSMQKLSRDIGLSKLAWQTVGFDWSYILNCCYRHFLTKTYELITIFSLIKQSEKLRKLTKICFNNETVITFRLKNKKVFGRFELPKFYIFFTYGLIQCWECFLG
jgi:hypothetical protein